MNNPIVGNVIGGVAVLLLATIARMLWKLTGTFHRFMTEHAWLLATTLWTRDKVTHMLDLMNIPHDPPPDDLPARARPRGG